MKSATIIKKRRLHRKTTEALRLIGIGNNRLYETIETLGPTITTDEYEQIYKSIRKIMDLQCRAYRVMLSEKEETWS